MILLLLIKISCFRLGWTSLLYHILIKVPLPQMVGGVRTHSSDTSDRQAYGLQERLHHEFAIEVPIKCLENRLYVRLSAHVYNTPKDYQRLAHVMKTLI